MDYQPAEFQCCRLSLASFMDKLRKHNNEVIMTSYHVVQKFKICKTEYKLSFLQVSTLGCLDQIL